MRRWPLGAHLLLAVNVPLAIMLAVLLVFEYRDEMDQALLEKEAGLADEAIAVHQAVVHLPNEASTKSTEDFIERVCEKMRVNRSPGHVIFVVRGRDVLLSHGHSQLSADENAALLNAFRDGRSRFVVQSKLVVLGGYEDESTAVIIAELATNIRRSAWQEVLWRLASLSALAVVAAAIVDTVLFRLITRPLRRMATSVDAVAGGEFGATLEAPRGRELQTLTQSFNSMSLELANEEHRRRREMERAREIQEHLLPTEVRVPGLVVRQNYQPAEDVAGDYYDLIPLSNGTWLIVIADVAGHGIPAAMAATLLKALLLCASQIHQNPDEILREVNRHIASLLPDGIFVTTLIAVWHPDTGQLVYVNAGHPSGLLWNSQLGFRELSASAVPVGILADVVYQPCEVQLTEDDRLVWFTDGLIEAFSPTGEMFGQKRLQELIATIGRGSLEGLHDAILSAVRAFVGDRALADDLTLLVIGRDAGTAEHPSK